MPKDIGYGNKVPKKSKKGKSFGSFLQKLKKK